MAHYRSISFCNILYKIISKVLSNIFQKVEHLAIDEAQSAFLPRRLITDNTIIAFEVFHSINNTSSTKDRNMGLKQDMGKAFDRLNGNFLRF